MRQDERTAAAGDVSGALAVPLGPPQRRGWLGGRGAWAGGPPGFFSVPDLQCRSERGGSAGSCYTPRNILIVLVATVTSWLGTISRQRLALVL